MAMPVDDQETVTVIADFIEKGLVENIVVMFKRDPAHYRLTGALLRDERFMVRMGVAILFEELAALRPDDLHLAIPALVPLLDDPTPYVRGEACTILSIIAGEGHKAARGQLLRLRNDPDPQVREIVEDSLAD